MNDNLYNRSIQIAGSYSNDIDKQIVDFSHDLIKFISRNLFEKEAIIVSAVGKEDCNYDWDILETAYEYATNMSFSDKTREVVKVISSEKSESQIPNNRKELWHNITGNGIISLNRIKPGWNAGAIKRQKQEEFSDALLILGGGEGIEHSAYLHVLHGKPVLALDIPIGSSYKDGLGGSPLINRKSISDPDKFFPRIENTVGTKLVHLNFENWKNSPIDEYAYKVLDFLEFVIKPQVFYIRLLNKKMEEYNSVEKFFRNVVDPIVKNLRYSIVEMDTSYVKNPFLNVEIFREIHNSSVIIADLSGLRPNCFVEMGYSFGLNKKVLLTAMNGTILPFDSNQIPCFFWSKKMSKKQQEEFSDFWKRNISRSNDITMRNLE